MYPSLKAANEFSTAIIEKLDQLNKKYSESGVCLAITGSLGRQEATIESDFDAYIICENKTIDRSTCNELWAEAAGIANLKKPSNKGSFGSEKISFIDEILVDVGGNNDTNIKISQRILIILESKFCGSLATSDKLVDSIIKRYISDEITNHQIGMFLLNDIIRFYRTMCVDFEYKTIEDSKPWAIRNVKLVFSRKLIYFAGLLMCAEMAQASAEQKRTICKSLMKMSPTERIRFILGSEALKPLKIYDEFLQKIGDASFRKKISKVSSQTRATSAEFTDLKNRGHHFAWALRAAFNHHYDSTHPIHRAIMF